jgi:lipopolysaccharide transport system ATP-binding protein
MAEAGVRFERVWKKFRRGERHDSFRDLLPSLVRGLARGRRTEDLQDREFWAVRDVSFEVHPGEALGIIGPNGAGKSTVLKLLTRILRPSRGVCSVRGRVGALIEVAAGFHPDLTGRENVYLQGAIMGMKRAEISGKFDQIIEFSGVGDFIDTPVKRYSSGMNARLGFAIAAHLDPDVLLIDEVLSVGDAAFQDRCIERMRELLGRGVPTIFISHNLPAVLQLCSRVVVLDRGTVRFEGAPADAVAAYRTPSAPAALPPSARRGPIWITGASLLAADGQPSSVFDADGGITVRIQYYAREVVARPQFAVDIHRADGVYCTGINTRMDGQSFGPLEGSGVVDLHIPRLSLLPGCYVASTGILDGALVVPLDLHLKAYPFSVTSTSRQLGVVHLDHSWTHGAALPPAPAPAASQPIQATLQAPSVVLS